MFEKILTGPAGPIAFFKNAVGRFIKTPLRCTQDGSLYVVNVLINSRKLADAAIAVGPQAAVDGLRDPTFSSFLTGNSGALRAVAEIYGSPDKKHWRPLGTLIIDVAAWASESDDGTDDFWIKTSWPHIYADITELTGDGAKLTIHESN